MKYVDEFRDVATVERLLDDVRRRDEHVRAGHVARHEIRGELDAREREIQAAGDGPDKERLAQPGRPLEEDVPSREDPPQRLLDDVVLPDHGLPDRLSQPRARPLGELEPRLEGRRGRALPAVNTRA